MPAAMEDTANTLAGKRKRQEDGDLSKKRRRSIGRDGDDDDFQATIKRLEAEIQESKNH